MWVFKEWIQTKVAKILTIPLKTQHGLSQETEPDHTGACGHQK